MKNSWIEALERIVGAEYVDTRMSHTEIYSYDASLAKGQPDAVVFPANTAEVADVIGCTHEAGVPLVSRGFGTNLSGGTVLLDGGLVVSLSRLNRILNINPVGRTARLQPGVTNLELQNALAGHGFFYAPDPASQKVATLGGNIGENSGGPRCLKYGVTTNHILGMEFVMADGSMVHLGGDALDPPGYDLRGVVVGSEGTFGVATELTVRILPIPETVVTMLAVYDSVGDAARSVSDIMAAGILPATLEMMDNLIIQAVEDSLACGYPRDAAAVLIIEVEGLVIGLSEQAESIETICMNNGCRQIKRARDNSERNRLWEGRRGAFGAVARLAPNYLVNDCSVPRSKLPEALEQVNQIASKYGFEHGNVFHAGDGNLHPLMFFDSRDKQQMQRVKKAGWEIMEACARLGGTISGEHGIGIEKREAMYLVFSDDDLDAQRSLKAVFDPHELLNPGKAIPPSDMPGNESHPKPQLITPSEDYFKASPDEKRVLTVLREALATQQAVIPVGCATSQSFGNLLSRKTKPVSSRPLDRILNIDANNQVVIAEAGVSLADIQEQLGAYGLWLPIRPPLALGGHSLGGMTALGACGPERLRYGSPRDLLLGLRYISGQGKLVSTGGRVMKNVTGYDMTRLLAGSAGTLGYITRMTFRLAALPQCCKMIAGRGGLKNCCDVTEQLMTSVLEPTHITAKPVGTSGPNTSENLWHLAVGFEGFSKTVEDQLSRMQTLMVDAGLDPEPLCEYDPLSGWLGDDYALLESHAYRLRGQFPLNHIWEMAERSGQLFPKGNLHLDVGSGLLMMGLETLSDEDWNVICGSSKEADGTMVLDKAPEAFKQNHDVFGLYQSEWKLTHQIKATLDPATIFSPGRLPGKV